jgi:WXG100 family type VII secretion target
MTDNPGLVTETAAMQTEAGNFDRIAGELTAVMNQVGMTAAGLAASLQGEAAGPAAQAALTRYEEAARQQTQLLTEISHNVQQGGVQYDTVEMDNAEALAQQML